MTTLKLFSASFFICLFFFQTISSKASPVTGTKVSELNSQIVQEVKEVLKTPYLKFADKNLTGKVQVITVVDKNGKIVFKDIKGINENLVSNIIEKLNSLNLWTSTEYSSKQFSYMIKYKD